MFFVKLLCVFNAAVPFLLHDRLCCDIISKSKSLAGSSPIYVGSNLGLKCGRERPIRDLSPRFEDQRFANK